MGLLNERIQPLGYENSALANYQPQQPKVAESGIMDSIASFIPGLGAFYLAGKEYNRSRQMQQQDAQATQGMSYAQLAEYWAQRGDPEKAAQYAELAGAGQPKQREVFARSENVVDPQTGQSGMLLTYRNGEQEFKPVQYAAGAAPAVRAAATPRVPVGMMWDPVQGRAVQIPGVPVKAAPVGRETSSAAAPKSTKPLTPTEFKELTETEDTLSASKTALSAIDKAIQINPLAYSGVTANMMAKVQSEFGGSPRADATIEMDNLIQNQALSSMKSIFGGNPTEGERKILLDLQASATKTPKQREEILKRAKSATEARISGMQNKAQAIRTREYGTPSYAPAQIPAAAPKIKRYNPATGRIE